MASVIHGFIYNKDAFDELGLEVPTTEAEFFAVLDKIKEDGTYIPMAMGTKDQWEAATMGYQNIGPNYWKGEEGRLALIEGEQKLTDAALGRAVRGDRASGSPISATASRRRPIPTARTCSRSAAPRSIPAGSWEISPFGTDAQFEMGAFPPPVKNAGDKCYISDHVDIAHRASTPPARTRRRPRPSSSGSARRSSPSSTPTRCPASSPLSKAPVTLEDPLARSSSPGASKCKSTIRLDLPDPVAAARRTSRTRPGSPRPT